MPVETDADRMIFVNPNDFGTAVRYDGGTIYGVFDNETVEVQGPGYVPMLQEQPRLECRTSDIERIEEGRTMIIDNVAYLIRAWHHDGKGMTKIILEKQ